MTTEAVPPTTAPADDRETGAQVVTDGSPSVRVVVADDHPLYRQGIVRALEAGGFAVVGEAADGVGALDLIRLHEPDAALLDVSMPGLDGIDVVAALARRGPAVPIVLLSAFCDEPLVTAGLQAGAVSYILKTADRDEICRTLATAAATGLAPGALAGGDDVQARPADGWLPRLTFEEHRLLQLAHTGADKANIALLAGLDEPTVRRRLSSAIGKLGADTLPAALVIAARLGLVR